MLRFTQKLNNYRGSDVRGDLDNSNSACRMIKTHLITVQGSQVTLVATVMIEGELW